MSGENFEISRRKALAAIGTTGIAASGAGLGTSAFFSDTETFEGNKLTAGELDLKVDWEEHYSDWSDDEAAAVSDIVMTNNDPANIPDGYVGLPDPNAPLIAIPEGDVDAFQDATSIEAMPDLNNDGIQDDLTDVDVCSLPWDTPEILDPRSSNGPTLSDGPRTDDGATEDTTLIPDGEDGMEGAPLIYLDDVKPGDFGELTLSIHNCDNPGYLWLQGEPVTAAENGNSDPEGDDDDEMGAEDESYNTNDGDTVQDILDSDVELLDAIQTMFWYDEDGDNVYEPGGVAGNVDVSIVFDVSGSMDNAMGKFQSAKDGAKTLVNTLDSDDQVSLFPYETNIDSNNIERLTNNFSQVNTTIDNLNDLGFTNIEAGVTYAAEELLGDENLLAPPTSPSGNDDDAAEKVMVVLSDGNANRSLGDDGSTENLSNANDAQEAIDAAQAAKDEGVRVFSIAYGDDATATTLQSIASSSDDFFDDADIDNIEQVFAQIAQAIVGEKCFLSGSLRDTLRVLSSSAPNSGVAGVPLDGNRAEGSFVEVGGDDTDSDGVPDENLTLDPAASTDIVADEPTAAGRDCYANSETQHIGFAWWLPVDHANEIQTDSVSFDLGFYTEQCRHNDGAGQTPEA
ncbi:VWA domain-containing protein [Haloarchaeobius sp. DYHT-AS-18]|uniref:vWA domain-containing protein n=1 Tax=Haloarchaeobius sp. DYHT-AS-18 TaxID=3446117 RepID=UPI003EBE0582